MKRQHVTQGRELLYENSLLLEFKK